jgi:hypothetical protein
MSLILNGTDGLSDIDGTAATPAIRGTDTNTGIFFPAADTIAFSEGGTEAMRINGSGNLGVGTINPIAKTTIAAANTVANTRGNLYVYTTDTATANFGGMLSLGGSYSGTSEAPFANIAGRWDGSGINGYMQFSTINSGTVAERMRIDSSGNVGIGTSSPTQKLNVTGTTHLTGAGTFPTTGSGIELVPAAVGGTNYIQAYNRTGSAWQNLEISSAQTTFGTGGTERMRITSDGNLYVGTTSAWFGRKVILEGDSGVAGILNSADAFAFSAMSTASSGNNKFHAFYTDSKTSPNERGSIDFNRAGGLTRYNTTSDATLKNIIGDANPQVSVDILKSTKLREYAWKDDAEQKPQIGVIAQELHETFKGAVSVGGENANGQYSPWSVDKTAFAFHLIAGWQEHEKLIQELKATVDAQAARIAALESAGA